MAILPFNEWNWDAEPGDIMVSSKWGTAYRLYESNGWYKRMRGKLSRREIKKPGYKAIRKENEKGIIELVWLPEKEWEEYRTKRAAPEQEK